MFLATNNMPHNLHRKIIDNIDIDIISAPEWVRENLHFYILCSYDTILPSTSGGSVIMLIQKEELLGVNYNTKFVLEPPTAKMLAHVIFNF
jgi:hypothetical protein